MPIYKRNIRGLSLAHRLLVAYPIYMDNRAFNKSEKWFPCPVCLRPLDVRSSKRDKPYVICSLCGVQMFVREKAGIAAFLGLVEQGLKADVLTRIGQLEQRYKFKCPECAKPFWANPSLQERSLLTGTVSGYRCPERNCRGIAPIEESGQK